MPFLPCARELKQRKAILAQNSKKKSKAMGGGGGPGNFRLIWNGWS